MIRLRDRPFHCCNFMSVVIIAGAWGDVGRSIAHRFFQNGYKTVALGRRRQPSTHVTCAYDLDLADTTALEQTAGRIWEEIGPADIVVNAAGAYTKTLEESWDEGMHRNNFCVAENCLKSFTPRLLQTPNSRIITIGSIDAVHPNMNSFSYSIAKGSIRTMVHLYKKKYRDSFLNFDLILPGGINTRMRAGKEENKERLLQPSDIAELCLNLASLKSRVSLDDIVVYPKSFSYSN